MWLACCEGQSSATSQLRQPNQPAMDWRKKPLGITLRFSTGFTASGFGYRRGQCGRLPSGREASRGPACRPCTFVHILAGVSCEWDTDKAISNLQKHGVDFADAALVLEDLLALTSEDTDSKNERRWVTLGRDPLGQVVVVCLGRRWFGHSADLRSTRDTA